MVGLKYITIATDISLIVEDRIATWACYIRSSHGTIKVVRQFKVYDHRAQFLETLALANALAIVKKNIPDFSQSNIIIYNEIEHVIRPILNTNGNIKQKDVLRSNYIKEIIMPILNSALSYEIRDVKAHYTGQIHSFDRNKYYMNDWCDKNAKKLSKQIKKDKRLVFYYFLLYNGIIRNKKRRLNEFFRRETNQSSETLSKN